MRKFLLVPLLFCLTNAHCENWRNPEAKFDTRSNMTNKVTVTWHTVNNVQEACEKTSREKGLGGFGYSVDACSFWNSTVVGHYCDIYTRRATTMHELGHEIRHCFQGSFHSTPK